MAQLTKVDGDKIRLRRENCRLSVDQAADLIDCHPATLSNIELGHRQPSIELLARIEKALKAAPGDFVLDTRPAAKASR